MKGYLKGTQTSVSIFNCFVHLCLNDWLSRTGEKKKKVHKIFEAHSLVLSCC